jgi:hypothetical protein
MTDTEALNRIAEIVTWDLPSDACREQCAEDVSADNPNRNENLCSWVLWWNKWAGANQGLADHWLEDRNKALEQVRELPRIDKEQET